MSDMLSGADTADAPSAHPELMAASVAVAAAPDKLAALHSEALRLARFTVIGDIRRLKASAFLFTVAKECGLCETDSEAKTVKYVIGTGLEGRPIVGNFGPLANDYAETPVSWKERLVTAAELKAMAFGPVRYIVPRLVPEGVTLLIGRPKIGEIVACA